MDLHIFLEQLLKSEPKERVIEFGTGHSTKILSAMCGRVISIDENPFSVLIPVSEQRSFDLSKLPSLRKPSNVHFICDSILKMEFNNSTFKEFNPQLIVFDLGMTLDDKYLYRVGYDRLKVNAGIPNDCIIVCDNSDSGWAKEFKIFLETFENYQVVDNGVQFIARKK